VTRRLYLVRHGAAEGAEGRAIGHTDLPLAAGGRRAIERLAATWQGPPPDRLVASPLTRAAESAEILATGWSLEPALDPRLAEMSFGSWDGCRWDEIHARDGERLADWAAAWTERTTPAGEAFATVMSRMGRWFDDEWSTPSCRVLVAVTHGGPIRALLAARLAVPSSRLWDLPVGLARVTALANGAGGSPRLLVVDSPSFRRRGPA
jgi:broad specificity phosphatase PhoE